MYDLLVCFMASVPSVGKSLLIHEVSRLYKTTHRRR